MEGDDGYHRSVRSQPGHHYLASAVGLAGDAAWLLLDVQNGSQGRGRAGPGRQGHCFIIQAPGDGRLCDDQVA
jgi:hypothetical protein